MKKIISILLTAVMLLTLVGCSNRTQSSEDGKDGKTPYIQNGYWFIDGTNTGVKAAGTDGINGTNGTNGLTPFIGVNGNWWIGGSDTEVKAAGANGINGTNGTNGTNGLTPHIGENGNWWIGGSDTEVKATGTDGINGTNGTNGTNGLTPHIGENGNWWIGDLDTEVKAEGVDGINGTNGTNGTNGLTPHIGENGNWWIGDPDTEVKAEGTDGTNGTNGTNGLTPHIGENGNWWIGDLDTEVKAEGVDGINGTNGTNGLTPHIGENGNWWIGDLDTEVKAAGANGINGTNGTNGTNGLTPHIGENGNWWIGDLDTEVKAAGANGTNGTNGTNGLTPFIGENGNWWIGDEDTGVKASNCAHKYADDWTIEIAANCDTVGVSSNTCTLCGNMKYQFVDKTEHQWIDVYTLDADCLNPKILQTCTGCAQSRISRTPLAKAHTFPDVYADGNTCSVCGEYQPTEGLEYWLLDDGTYGFCGIGSFNGTILVIPSIHEGQPVTEISTLTDVGEAEKAIEKVFIPASVVTVHDYVLFNDYSNLKYIQVDTDNPAFKDIQNKALYSKDGTQLIRYMPALTGTFSIPECVTEISGYSAFDDCMISTLIIGDNVISANCDFLMGNNLTSIYIGRSYTGMLTGQDFNLRDRALTEINVSEYNEKYKTIDGVLYSKDGSKLICYPLGKSEIEFVVPESVTSIGHYAFYYASNLQKISLPDSLVKIGVQAFSFCYKLKEAYIPDTVTEIGDLAFLQCYELDTIVIGKSIEIIGYDAFTSCGFDKIFYSGTPSEWNSIEIGEYNDSFLAVTRYYYSEEKPTSAGNYWHYVDGIPSIWI